MMTRFTGTRLTSHRPRRRFGLRDVVILTAPAVLVLLYLVAASAVAYYRAIQFDDYWSAGVSVDGQFRALGHELLRLPAELVIKHRLSPEREDPRLINLKVPAADLDADYRDPQLGWGLWMDGTLAEPGNRLLPVRIRKRGDNSVHWLTEKKTLTVRTRKTEFYKRYRTFGLSAKDVLTAWVANDLARQFGLLAPSTSVVPVYLNNQYAGMFRFIEVVDESFLRASDRMPGNVFRGDAAERGEHFKGLNPDLFSNPYIWDRVAVSDRPTGPDAGQLRLFMQDLNGGSFADHQRMMRRVDPDEIARLMTYLLLVGDPYHMDAVHNQLWYEDPSTSLLHPIPWDIRLLPLRHPGRVRMNHFLREALRDPWLVDLVLSRLEGRLADSTWLHTGDSLATTAWNRYHDGFAYDSLREGLVPPLGTPSEVHRDLAENAGLLRSWLADSRVAFAAAPAPAGTRVLDFQTRGMAGAELTALTLPPGNGRVSLRLDANDDGVLDAGDPAVPGRIVQAGDRRFVPDRPVALLAAWRVDQPAVRAGVQHYRLFLSDPDPGAVRPLLRNRYTGAAVLPEAWPVDSAITPSASWHPWRYPTQRGRTVRLSGTVHLTADLQLSAADTLVIEPGATLRIDPDVSIISRGRVIARGTETRPILVTRADAARPWGAFALQGGGADSSAFAWITFEWGGGTLVDRVEYTGMFNIHRAHGVTVDHATFRDNLRSDDTFHALLSSFSLRNSHFLRANSDAVDLDISSGIIAGNTFDSTGGDAIDLMTSTPLIRDNVIRFSGDKGVSVGEASAPIIYNNRIEGCRRGIEVKDRSAPVILSNLLDGNQAGLWEDRKNWRYGGGGWATVVNTVVRDNPVPLHLDGFSRVTILDSPGLGPVTPGGGNPAWLYRRYGLVPADSPGLVGAGQAVPAVVPLDGQQFDEDFETVAGGWQSAGGVTHLEKENLALHVTTERKPGLTGRKIDWDLRHAGAPATLALELATHSIDSAQVVAVSPEGNVIAPLPLSDDPTYFRLASVTLPPRRYTALVLRIFPHPRIEKLVKGPGWTELKPGQLWLRHWALYSGVEAGH